MVYNVPKGSTAVTRERENRAVALLAGGKTFTEIAEIVGYADRGSAYNATFRAIRRETVDNVDEVRDLELSRIDRMVEASWPMATASITEFDKSGEKISPLLLSARMDNQLKAQATILKLMERRARYLPGIETPIELKIEDLREVRAEAETLVGKFMDKPALSVVKTEAS